MPVRLGDPETVRLLRRGDRVDVIAADREGEARVLVSGARVWRDPDGASGGGAAGVEEPGGALVVLSVPRQTAAELAGAGTRSELAVTLW
ncbi:hypothetical protein [Streptomyces sp. SCSIO ZS0520]|uniref:hypothetical protein n=1 Tax=Streptomyces sp. SCSIO ZS0520 TaxID=2892996 RepID=UPI0021D8F3DE|nr:hypothetical protein [Streptomyces sp. SCSIO ZS0520]